MAERLVAEVAGVAGIAGRNHRIVAAAGGILRNRSDCTADCSHHSSAVHTEGNRRHILPVVAGTDCTADTEVEKIVLQG